MSTFYPEKLSVEYTDGVAATGPVIPRRYTLTHSDVTGELFLNIGIHYAWDKITPLRDEVLAEWKQHGSSYYFSVYLSVDQEQHNLSVSAKRNEIFRRELPLALTAIRYGDRLFFNKYPHLDQAFMIINFISAYPQFASLENWGTFQSMTI